MKITVISLGKITGKTLCQQILKILDTKVDVEYCLLSELNHSKLDCDFIVYSSSFVFDHASIFVDKKTPYIISDRVIDHSKLGPIIELESGMNVLLVNDAEVSALEAIEQMNELGLDHVNYSIYYPTCTDYPKLDIAVTPGEGELIPDCVHQVIDIGPRIMDIRSINNLLIMLGLGDDFRDNLTKEYIHEIVEISKMISANKKQVKDSETTLSVILDHVDIGICFLNNVFLIQRVNKKFNEIYDSIQSDLYSKSIDWLIPEFNIKQINMGETITTVNEEDYLLQIQLVDGRGYLLFLEPINKIFKQDQKAKKSYEKRFRRNLYVLEDYLTRNEDVKRMLKKVKKFASDDATVLIQGENGTGKEILAQGIHMASSRKDKPFIPVNIASISPTLLESELFGYEEGSFTGAQKGGKPGLFEIANSGTLFIDEIGDAPLTIQSRLLRVLQERKVRRVGGRTEVSVNVRIIAATNKDLLLLVEQGVFRRDLFFRLNILPVTTIPLRQRRDDILYLLNHFIEGDISETIDTVEQVFSKEAINHLMRYPWKGNIRELINIVDYTRVIYEDKALELSELPEYLLFEEVNKEDILLDNISFSLLKWVSENKGIGRKKIHEMFLESNIAIGEGVVRGVLEDLKSKKLIYNSGKGKGSIITELGNRVLQRYIR